MAQKKRGNRPQTSKEARNNFNRRGGMTFTSDKERKQLLRELEQDEKHQRAAKAEAARKDANKRRAEREAKARQERRRLGIPEPTAHVRASQMRIAGFLRGPAEAPPAGLIDHSSCDSSGDEFADLDTDVIELEERLKAYEAASRPPLDQATGTSAPEGHKVIQQPDQASRISRAGGEENLPGELLVRQAPEGLDDDLDSFLGTNSQIERELECTQSLRSQIPVPTAQALETIRAKQASQLPANDVWQPATLDDVALLLGAVPEDEFQRLNSEEGQREVASFLNMMPTQEWDDFEG